MGTSIEAMSTAIQWTDVTDNIIVVKGGGWWCRKISDGCKNCYAAKLNQSAFFGGNKLAYSGPEPELELRRDILESWARQRKPKRHFVASMTDVFGDWVPMQWIFEFLDAMAAAPDQTFQILTKRADVMARAVTAWRQLREFRKVPKNIWLGVSIENQKCADERIPVLLKISAAVRFLSIEPLLERVDLQYPCFNGADSLQSLEGLHWVIVGGESGRKARPCNVEWIRSIVQQCKAARVPCFVKQLGSESTEIIKDGFGSDAATVKYKRQHPKGGDPAEWPANLRVREFPNQLIHS